MVFTGIAVMLIFVVVLTIRQYQLTKRYNIVISQSEEMIFQFSTVREEITTALIEKDWQKIVRGADRLKNLNSVLARLQENTLIPGEYRLDLAKQADLSGLAIASRGIISSRDKVAYSLRLQRKMRVLAGYLEQFDRVIVGRMRAKVVRFQTMMIGALAAVICLISFSLLFFYKRTMLPIMRLVQQTGKPDIYSTGFSYDNDACSEVVLFTDAVNDLLKKRATKGGGITQHGEHFATLINESTNLANGIINYAQLLADSCREVGIGGEERKILETIIEAAERIAKLNKEI